MSRMRQVPALPKARRTASRLKNWLVMLAIITALALLFAGYLRSPYSKLGAVELEGLRFLSEAEVIEVAQLYESSWIWSLRSDTVRAILLDKLSVREANVERIWPNALHIEVFEFDPVVYMLDQQGEMLALLMNGATADAFGHHVDRPLVTGWTGHESALSALVAVLSEMTTIQLSDISEIRPAPSLSYPDKITMYTHQGIEVETSLLHLQERIDLLPHILRESSPGRIIMLEAITFVPFDDELEETDEVTPEEE